jgi:autotransporter-associated beta strand protein
LDVGLYTSLHSVNGNPAIAYYDSINQDVYFIRSTDANGAGWPNPELIDSSGNVGVGISLSIGNIGGDILTRDNRGTQDVADDEVTISGVANIGTPTIVYGDATNSRLKIAVADNANGVGFNGVGISQPVRNWSLPVTIPGTGDVGRHFSLTVVAGFPTIVYQSSDTQDLKFIRALNVAGVSHNLRDPADSSILRILVSALTFTPTGSWDAPITLDSTGDVGSYPSIAFINGQPTTPEDRPAVSYYDATNGDLKLVTAIDPAGSTWNEAISVLTVEDVGRSNALLIADSLPAMTYYNATTGDLGFIILNNASGYTRISSTADMTWSGSVALNGTTIFAPAAGTTSEISGTITGLAGFRLVGEGILSLTGVANNFATSLASPGVTTGPSAAVNGGVILRSGTLHLGNSFALGGATVELGDAVPQVITVDRATAGSSMLRSGGLFNPLHDGLTLSDTGPGAFVGVSATVDGKYLGLVSTTANPGIDRFTGDLADGTAVKFYGAIMPVGIQGDFTYYVRSSGSGSFQVSLTLGGAAVNFNSEGSTLFFIEDSKLNTQILVKDQGENPEWNGVYRPTITTDTGSLEVGKINLVRVASMDSVSEMPFGVRVVVQNGSSGGKAFLLASTVSDLNSFAVHWVEETPGGSVALLANAHGLTIANAIDVNAIPGSAASILGAAASVNSGNATFIGPVTLQNLASSAVDAETLQVTSSTSTGLGVGINGVISEAAVQDVLTLNKTGVGVVSLGGNNTFKGGISINQGTLLVMNTPSVAGDSGTGSGMVTVNAGTCHTASR